MQPVLDTHQRDTHKGAPPFGKFERKLSMRYLGARKSEGGVGLISVLSFLCIMLAIFAMVTIMSIMNGFRETTLALTLGTDGHMYVASAQANPPEDQIEDLRARVQSVTGVDIAFPFTQHETFIQASGRNAGARVVGIANRHLQSMTLISENLIVGDLNSFGTGLNGGDKIIIGIGMANGLGLTVGDKLTIYSPILKTTPFGSRPVFKAYEIGGVFDTGLVLADSMNVYMPLEQAELFFQQGRAASEIQLRLEDPDMIHALKPLIREAAGVPIFVLTWEDKNSGFATALRTEQIAMRFIFMIVVVIAVFPVLAAMIMLVKNKGKDIAILRTIGATSSSVMRVFLMSGAMIGVLGTFAGVVLGILFCINIGFVQSIIEAITGTDLFPPEAYGIDHLPVKIVPLEVFWVSFWGFLVSALATFFPALTASKIDPVEALRYE
ncbi:MAG: lipoprotein-releasing system transmembrane subunit LolC [Robiginitomaculum sp.]|nr:MAG: lipoprotein-releasing system transmembrane subunit LolC [Robiginitomaculum sp.]